MCFPVNSAEFLRIYFFIENFWATASSFIMDNKFRRLEKVITVWPTELANYIVCKMFVVQTFLWSLEFHCMKSVRIQSFSGPYFPTIECGITWTRKTPNTDTFYEVFVIHNK